MSSRVAGGLLPEDPFLETYLVRPGGATVVALEPDERLTVVDSYGGQVAELTVLSPEGADDAGALGTRADAPATVLRELVRNGNGFLQQLAAPKLRPGRRRSPFASSRACLRPGPRSRSAPSGA